MEKIPVSGPWITDKEIEYVADAARNAWYENANIYNDRFERAFAEYMGLSHAVALPSCTSALHLSLMALGIGPGDEVIVPDVTWIATAAPIIYVGATPVFADIDVQNWCLSPASFQDCITPRTKAVIPVDLYGGMPDWEKIHAIARRNNLGVIEDAAEALGSEYKGQKAGCLGDTGCFSFHGSKTMTTGEGGMLVTNNKDLFDRVLFLRDHGRKPGDVMFFNSEVGHKYKMSSMQAALGLAQIERAEELVDKKRQIFDWYHDRLGSMDGLTLNFEPDQTKNSYWMVSIILDSIFGIQKEALIQKMNDYGLSCRPFFYPLSAIPAFNQTDQAAVAQKRNRISYQISPYGINLPCGMNMDEKKVNYVCSTLLQILNMAD
ncbi:DegT/DnrJ/EryC1/StrS family aminotransferase [Desulfobacula sp.]|uniref:DegT/DnrJ/EryC1/StrS family aminotransferase n=1 Tax=Desulfobacula sp. TaxID=2593537 RepID=UPI00262593BD|nr:DegT/DnrJ/EryC1/StrS family aminotransferase [Desulfobacula sp.]